MRPDIRAIEENFVTRGSSNVSHNDIASLLTYIKELEGQVERMRAGLVAAEACMTIVPPYSDTGEYLATLEEVRSALTTPNTGDRNG